MTVSSTAALSGPYTGDGSVTAFPFTFAAKSTSEVAVYADGEAVSSGLYSVTLASSGGTVTFTTAPANGVSIVIVSAPSFLQDIDLQNNGAYRAATFDEAHDRSAIRDIWLKAAVTALLPDGALVPGTGAGQFLARDADGSPVFSSGTGADAGLRTDLAAAGGAALSGFLAPGLNPASLSVQTKLRNYGIAPNDYTNLFAGAADRQISTIISSGGSAYTWTAYQQTEIAVDPGLYTNVAAISSEDLSSFMVRARVPGTVTLDRSNKTDYFFERAGGIYQADVRGINVFGGKGLLRHSLTTVNVQGYQVYEDLVLLGYTECGISSDSINMPYWKLNRDVFRGTDTSIGFALAGFYDASSIIDCEFHNGRYGLKVVGDRSSTLSVERTSFFTIRPGSDNTVNPSKESDVWIGPSPTFSAAGAGTFFRQIRFGPENMSLDKPRVLFADENAGSGTHVGNRVHSTSASTGYVDGFAFYDSCIFGNAPITAPFIRSYTPNVSRLRFDGNWTGSPHTYMIQYMPTEGAEDTYLTRKNYVRIMPPSPGERPFQTAVSNRAIGVIEDPFGVMQDDSHVQLNGFGDDLSYVLLARVQGKDGNVGGGPTKATVASAFKANPNAAEVTVSANGGRTSCWYYDIGAITPNTLARMHLHLKSGATLPLTTIGYELYNTATGKSAIFGQALLDPVKDPDGVRLDLKWIGHVGDTGTWRVVVYALDYLAATRTKFQIGTLSVYHSRTWMNQGHVRTIGSGLWDDSHIVLGANHLWIDASGRLRIKSSAPTSDTDGTIVGTQS